MDPILVRQKLQQERFLLTGQKPDPKWEPKPFAQPLNTPVNAGITTLAGEPLFEGKVVKTLRDVKLLENIHLNNRAPNYRENGQLRLRHCYDCDKALVMFGASQFLVCPYCRWEEAAAFDWCEMELCVFEGIIDQIIKRHPSKPYVAGVLAYQMVGMNDDLVWEFVKDEAIIYNYELREMGQELR